MQTGNEIPQRTAVERKPVYVPLAFKGERLAQIARKRLTGASNRTFYAANLRVPFKSRPVVSLELEDKVSRFCNLVLYLLIHMLMRDNAHWPHDHALV